MSDSPTNKNFSWYPGHIKAAEEVLQKKWLPLLDMVIELVDSRVPITGKYPDTKLWKNKLILTVFTKADLTDKKAFPSELRPLIINSHKPHEWRNKLANLVSKTAKPILDKLSEKGRKRNLRIGVCGLPNVGKSTFLNSLSGLGKKAKTGDKPGITRQMQWIPSPQFDMLDTPGVIPFALDHEMAFKLAICGLLPEKLFDRDELSEYLQKIMQENYELSGLDFVQKKEQLLQDSELLLKHFQQGKLGKFCLDRFKA